MGSVLADTNALYWYLFEPAKLSAKADAALQDADKASGEYIFFSVISLIELLYLVEKGKLAANVLPDTLKIVSDPTRSFRPLAIDQPLAVSLAKIPRKLVPDLPDRIIAASGLAHSLPVVTSDKQIQQAPITTIW